MQHYKCFFRFKSLTITVYGIWILLEVHIGEKNMKNEGGTVRAFIAFSLPVPVMETLSALQTDLKKRGFPMKWVRPCNMHLTIKFLGEVHRNKLDIIHGMIRESALDYLPATICLEGVGVFPDIKRPTVLWVGVKIRKGRVDLFKLDLEKKLSLLGFSMDSRPFKGHVTLARIKKTTRCRGLGSIIKDLGGYESASFRLDAPQLFQSRLTPSGPEYTVHTCSRAVNDDR